MSGRPSKRAKKAHPLIQRGTHVEANTSRGIHVRNIGIAPAPSVPRGRENDGQGAELLSDFVHLGAPHPMDFSLPTEDEVHATYGKVVYCHELREIAYPGFTDLK